MFPFILVLAYRCSAFGISYTHRNHTPDVVASAGAWETDFSATALQVERAVILNSSNQTQNTQGENIFNETNEGLAGNSGVQVDTNLYLMLQDMRRCLIHYVEYQPDLLEYSKISEPFLKSSTHGRQKRARKTPPFKTQNIHCFITIFLTNGTEFKQAADQHQRLRHPFRFISTSFHMYQELILFLGQAQRPSKENLTFIQSLNEQTFLTPVFYLQYEFLKTTNNKTRWLHGTQQVILNNGWFICKYCSPNRFISHHFTCPEGRSCYDNLIGSYEKQIDNGRNVLWHVYNDPWSLDPDLYDDVISDPFHIRTVDDAMRVTMAFLLQAQNRTLIKEASTEGSLISAKLYETPKVIRKMDRIYARGSLHILSNGNGYVFITSDEVYDVYDLKSFYIDPFGPDVWYILVGIIAFLTALVSLVYIGIDGFVGPRIFSISFLWLVGSLLEQSGMRLAPKVTSSKIIWNFSKLTFGAWIVGTVPLLAFYKGRISASYSVVTPYATKWAQLLQLANFTLYSATWDCNFFPNDTYTLDKNTEPNLMTLCRQLPLAGHDAINCKFWTDVTERIYAIENHPMQNSIYTQRLIGYKNMESKMVYTCASFMVKLIQNELLGPSTAFISARDDFPIYWEYFKKEMTRNGTTRFAHNANVKDTTLTDWHINYLSTVDEYHHRVVLRRMEVLLSSGLRELWDRWSIYNRQYETFKAKALREAQKANQIALTFSGSDIPVIFYTHISISVLCVVVFSVELACWNRRKKVRPFPFKYLK